LTDLRSERTGDTERDTAAKTMMGAQQKAWFKRELLSAKANYPLIFWVSTVPWIGHAGVDVYPMDTNLDGVIEPAKLLPRAQQVFNNPRRDPNLDDYWAGFAFERREIADFIKENAINGLCILHGDAHMLAADDGRNADYAAGGGPRVRVLAAAPLDQDGSIKGGPYSQGVYRPMRGEGCFGLVSVLDQGDHLKVIYSGRNHFNTQRIGLSFDVPVAAQAK
jgi:phosphodiesterase/alkaline phosphatase D-like protein